MDDQQQDPYAPWVARLLILNVAAWTFTLGMGAYLWAVL